MGTKTSGTPNYPVTHEHRYFFGKLVVISSLHTSQNSIFPTCQVKYAVVYSDFPFLLGTKQGGACAQGFVNQGATWQFYGLCILLHQLTFLFSLCVIPWIFLLWIVCGSDNFFFFQAHLWFKTILIGLLCTELGHFSTCFIPDDCGKSCVKKELEVLANHWCLSWA